MCSMAKQYLFEGCINLAEVALSELPSPESQYYKPQPVVASPVACYQAVINQWRPQQTAKACK